MSAPFPGVLEQIAVQPGRAVSSGEVLAHVRTRALLPEESTDSSGFPAWGELPAGELSRPEAVEDATALQEERPVEPSDLDLTQLGSEIGYEDPAPDPHVIQGIVLNEGTTGRLPPEDQAPPVPGPASVVPPETRDNQDNAATSFDPLPNPSRPGGRAGDEDGPPSRPRNRPAPRTRSTLDRTDTKPTSLLNDMISSPRYTDPVVRAFLSNLRNAFASSAVTYADAVRAADDPAALKAFCAGSFPSLALTRSLVPLFHGDMDLWTGRWKAASRQPMRKERGAVRKTIGLIFRR